MHFVIILLNYCYITEQYVVILDKEKFKSNFKLQLRNKVECVGVCAYMRNLLQKSKLDTKSLMAKYSKAWFLSSCYFSFPNNLKLHPAVFVVSSSITNFNNFTIIINFIVVNIFNL